MNLIAIKKYWKFPVFEALEHNATFHTIFFHTFFSEINIFNENIIPEWDSYRLELIKKKSKKIL